MYLSIHHAAIRLAGNEETDESLGAPLPYFPLLFSRPFPSAAWLRSIREPSCAEYTFFGIMRVTGLLKRLEDADLLVDISFDLLKSSGVKIWGIDVSVLIHMHLASQPGLYDHCGGDQLESFLRAVAADIFLRFKWATWPHFVFNGKWRG